jgi:hypothetical protein
VCAPQSRQEQRIIRSEGSGLADRDRPRTRTTGETNRAGSLVLITGGISETL